jgi:DNA-binding MarR family transcriptional regulator
MSTKPAVVRDPRKPREERGASKNRSNSVSLERLLELASRRVAANTHQLLEGSGVQREEWRVLHVLADEQGRSMGNLALATEMNHPTLTKLIDRLVGKSWVMRNIDPRDSRRVIVFITDLGLQRVDSLSQPLVDSDERWALALGQRKAKQLRKLLGELISADD